MKIIPSNQLIPNYTSIMNIFSVILILIYIDVVTVCGLQPTIMKDLKQVEQASLSRISNKVKRAEEVLVFGNQQNKLSENNYLRADKRDIPSLPVPDVQNGIDKEELLDEEIPMPPVEPLPIPVPSYQSFNRYYFDRPEYDMELNEDRQKRNILSRYPLKYRNDKLFASEDNISRNKRESNSEIEDLLSILAMYEAEHQKHPTESKTSQRYVQPEFEGYVNDNSNEIELEDDDPDDEGEWLNGPVMNSHRLIEKPKFYPSYLYNDETPSRMSRKASADKKYARIVLSRLAEKNRPFDRRTIQRLSYG